MEPSLVLHVEVCQKADSLQTKDVLEGAIREEFCSLTNIQLHEILLGTSFNNKLILEHIDSITCFCNDCEKDFVSIQETTLKFYIYRLTQEESATETMQNECEELSAASHWILPSQEFFGLWESLYYDKGVKENLLQFVETAMMFADKSVNTNIITWNKVVLLHGPPGTGKTSLCKALSQKLAIRFNDRYSRGELVEINSHSLFSKWFSESGKLVMKLFAEIKVLLEDPKALVCILIDEIESLAHVRKACMNGSEPTDSIRVVNALLTQLDQIKRYPNVLILTTSNMTEAIDNAFVDRADIKQLIGNPSRDAIYQIYSSCLKELIRTGFIEADVIYELSKLKLIDSTELPLDSRDSFQLLELCKDSVGLSGRILRKIPFLTQALFVTERKNTISTFLKAMHTAVKKEKENNANL